MKQQEKILIIKNIKELSPEIKITQHSSKKFSLEITNKHELKLLETKKDLHLKIKTKKNSSLNLAIIPKEKVSLIIESELEENSSIRITCLLNKKTQIKHFAICKKQSTFEATNMSLSSLEAESKIQLKKGSKCVIKNNYYNYEEESKIKDVIIHEEKNTNSLIVSNSYLKNSKSDNRALIIIEPQANNSEGSQEAHALLEGKSKTISVPDLEILNNEVKCGHGSIITRIKNEDLFYFEARGITKKEAKKMMIKGQLLNSITENTALKNIAEKFVERGLK